MNHKDAITAKLSGGLGNQLFIFSAGLAAAKRLDVPLIIDKSNFSVQGESRSYKLQFLESFATQVVDTPKNNLLKNAFRKRLSNKIFTEENPIKFDSRFESITPGTQLEGYFQSYRYFESVEDLILNTLTSQNVSLVSNNTIALHLRRGDYLQEKTANFHGITSAKYAANAIDLVRSISGNIPVSVFSDDLPLAKSELEEYFSKNLIYVQQDGLSDLESLLQMSRAEHMIMSNSSFSWWAAFIMSKRNSMSVVVAPRPWFSDDSSAADLLLPHWISLDKR